MNILATSLMILATQREPDEIIGGKENPYLKRWHIHREKEVCNVYLHHFLRSDDDRALHCHPWDSTSIIMDGSYIEHLTHGRVLREPGQVISRTAETPHRIELLKDAQGNELPCWSLFITGPWKRSWGFHCPQGWVHWRDFEKAGCGE